MAASHRSALHDDDTQVSSAAWTVEVPGDLELEGLMIARPSVATYSKSTNVQLHACTVLNYQNEYAHVIDPCRHG